MLHMVALLAELERGLITERTRAGVKAAKRRGVKFERKPKLSSEQIKHDRDQIAGGKTAQAVAALLRVGRTTLWRALKA
jgi:DNA invertase Pin-like site-specific DNA recombinase